MSWDILGQPGGDVHAWGKGPTLPGWHGGSAGPDWMELDSLGQVVTKMAAAARTMAAGSRELEIGRKMDS